MVSRVESGIRVVQIGIGALGRSMTRYILERPNIDVAAAVDTLPELQGRDLGELCSLGRMGVPVSASLESALQAARADIALLTTVSDLPRIASQIEEILEHGLPIVTTCEELTYPWITAPQLAGRLDRQARRKGAAVLATGVNPGFLMDTLPICLSATSRTVEAIKVSRIQDAANRRRPFQNKIGANLAPPEFEEKKKTGALRHVGLTESMHMIASRLGWRLDRFEEEITPIIAPTAIRTGTMAVDAGMVAGVQQIGRGFDGKKERITLVFRASIGEPDPEDTVEILGEPHLVSTIRGGVNGDVATCAIALNAIPLVLASEPGLKTMMDLPPVAFSLLPGRL
jgi:hypothetical protein